SDDESITVTVHRVAADLEVSSSLPEIIGLNVQRSYTIEVTNHGPSTATAVRLTDSLPAGVHFVTAVASQGNWTYSDGVVLDELGDLASGATATLTLSMVPTQLEGPFRFSSTVVSAVLDQNNANNSVNVDTYVRTQADLRITGLQTSPVS